MATRIRPDPATPPCSAQQISYGPSRSAPSRAIQPRGVRAPRSSRGGLMREGVEFPGTHRPNRRAGVGGAFDDARRITVDLHLRNPDEPGYPPGSAADLARLAEALTRE